MPALPFKLNQTRRHHIPRRTHEVTNWPAYEASLRRRGSLTVWFSAEAVEGWAAEPRTTPGGQPWYSALAILTALTLRAVFRLAYRQTEGLLGSVVDLLGLALRVPDHTTLSRRAATLQVPRPRRSGGTDVGGEAEPVHLLVDSTGLKLCGAGEWLVEKHGTRTRRSGRKLHLGVDADTGRIVASALTGHDADDGAQVLVRQADQFAANVLPVIRDIRRQGATSLREIAAQLTARGVRTARGGSGRHRRSRTSWPGRARPAEGRAHRTALPCNRVQTAWCPHGSIKD